jgi:hypothetical protein
MKQLGTGLRFPPIFFDSSPRSWNLIANRLFWGRGKLQWRMGCCRQKRGIGAMTKLELLYAEKRKKFDQICALVAQELGYGGLSTLSGEHPNQVEDEAEHYVKAWEETIEFRTNLNLRPITPLRRLLNEHQDICDRILDEHDIEVGIWAYKKRPRRRPASF